MQPECLTTYRPSPKRKITPDEIIQFIAEHEGTPAQTAHDLMKWMGHEKT
jgi:hypothetical protein